MIVSKSKAEKVSELRAMVAIGLSQSTIDFFERRAWREGASRDETADAIAEGEADFRASLDKGESEPRDTLISPPEVE